MAHSSDAFLESYQITVLLGTGGRSAPYCARVTKLHRKVAIKVPHHAFAADSEREVPLPALLGHPNTTSMRRLEESGATRAPGMDLVDVSTLLGRIKQGPIPLSEAPPIAEPITEVLEYADERGINHRELRPANIAVPCKGAAVNTSENERDSACEEDL